MNIRGTILALCLGLIFTAQGAAKPPDPLNPTARDVAGATAWFDALDWPDLRGASYVELTFASKPDAPDAERLTARAFLLREDDQTLTIFCDGTSVLRGGSADLDSRLPYTVQQIPKAAGKRAEDLQLPYRWLDLRATVDELLARRHRAPSREDKAHLDTRQVQLDRTAVFVLARCCARFGQPDLAKRLDRELLRPAAPAVGWSGYPTSERFLAAVEDTMIGNAYWPAIGDYGGLSVSRAQALPAFEWMARAFPDSENHQWAADVAARLRPMIAEDEAHAHTARPLESMTPDERIAELIFRLRDQNGKQTMQPGWCDIFATGTEDSPAAQLVKLGSAAVPALLGAMEDQRLSRSVGNTKNYNAPTDPIWPVGDCAVEILGGIAGRDFWTASGEGIDTGNPGYLSDDENRREYARQRTAALYRVIRAWWQDVQTRGRPAVLAEGVRRGGRDSVEQARILAELDPAAAADAIPDGIQAADGKEDNDSTADWVRTELLEVLADIKTGDVTAALRRLLRAGSAMHLRLAAAQALFQHGDKQGPVSAMIGEWRQWRPLPPKSSFDDTNDPAPLIVFLGTCGNLDAMRALAERFASLPTDEKFTVLKAVTDSWEAMFKPRDDDTPLPPEVAAFGEQLAVEALADRTISYGSSGTGGDGSYNDPRVCDMAAHYLAEKWPERYAFKWLPTRLERERFLVQDANAWRTAHGQTPLPTPERPVLPAASRQPNIISVCEWKGGDALAHAPVGVGEVLTLDKLERLITRLHSELPDGCAGFGLTIERPGDRRGVAVEIEWLRGERSEPARSWAYNVSVTRGGESLYGVGGSGDDYPLPGVRRRRHVAAYDDQRAALAKALGSGADQTVAVYYSCRLQGG